MPFTISCRKCRSPKTMQAVVSMLSLNYARRKVLIFIVLVACLSLPLFCYVGRKSRPATVIEASSIAQSFVRGFEKEKECEALDHTMAGQDVIENQTLQALTTPQPLQRRHSDAQSKADRVGQSNSRVGVSSEGQTRGRPEILTSLPIHAGGPLAKPGHHLKTSLTENNTKRPSSSRNHTGGSLAAAHWVACQAGFVNTHDEAAASPKSQPTQSTQSSAGSTASIATTLGSHLPALQSINLADQDGLKPLEEISPTSFDLLAPPEVPEPQYSIEVKSELLLSVEHLRIIFDDPKYMQKFTDFLYTLKPESVPLLNYYLNLVKALRAIGYANAIIRELAGANKTPSSELPLTATISRSLVGRANETFGVLVQEELPAFVAHVWTRIVNVTIRQRITNTLPPGLHDLSEGLAEVFCLTDPSRDDNPIVFASEEFHRATQYGRRFAFGRNCRFLQGPKTNQHSIHRLREMLVMGKEHCEPLLNYRRDGSVFMNLLMITPLYDNRGKVRYHLGAQVDVSGLLKECAGLASLAELVAQRQHQASQASSANDSHDDDTKETRTSRDALSDLAEMFSLGELKMVQAPSGGAKPNSSSKSSTSPRPPPSPTRGESAPAVTATVTAAEEALTDNSISSSMAQLTSNSSLAAPNHRARGILDHYLLVRPAPSLRILFASPSLRVPGILQSPLLARIGGPPCVRDAVARALRDGDGVTAKVRWLARPAGSSASSTNHPNPNNPNPNPNLNPNAGTGAGVTVHGRNRWIHATPLLGVDGTVGVWMVILIDDEEKRRGLGAPPVEACNLERRRPFDVQIGADRLSQGNKSASEAGDEDRPAEADGAAAGRDDVGGPEIGAAHTRGAV